MLLWLFRHTAEYDVAVASWMDSTLAPEADNAAPAALVRPDGDGARRCATARTRISVRPSTATMSAGRVWPRPSSCMGKRDVPQQLHRCGSPWRAAFDHSEIWCRDHQARQIRGTPSSSVSVADAHRKAHECDPLSAFGGVIACNTEVTAEITNGFRDLHRGDRRPGLSARCRRHIGPQEEHPRARGGPASCRRCGDSPDHRWPADGERDGIDAAGDDPAG